MGLEEAKRIVGIHGLKRSKEIIANALPEHVRYSAPGRGGVNLDKLRQAIEVYEGRPTIVMYSNERGAAQVVINGQQINVYPQDWHGCQWRTPAERDQLIIDVALRRYKIAKDIEDEGWG